MTVLVTGGAGYVGSHMVHCLRESGRAVVVVDDLSTGWREAVPPQVPLVVADVADAARMRDVLREHRVEAILHFAARIEVGESVRDPRRFYRNNLVATIALLDAALDVGVRRFVLSSTAAVYGLPRAIPIAEDDPTRPINPYGETKLAVERLLAAYAAAYGVSYAALRYFNAAGAAAEAGLGERHDPESHLIPLVLDVALGRRPAVTVFGDDYGTPDGTCIRDYVHVLDLAEAHLAALAHLEGGGASGPFNLGTGRGYSVAEVIQTCRQVTGHPIPVEVGPRRPGDPASLVASARRAEVILGWRTRRSSLQQIVEDAWAWHSVPRPAGETTVAPRRRRKVEVAHAR